MAFLFYIHIYIYGAFCEYSNVVYFGGLLQITLIASTLTHADAGSCVGWFQSFLANILG